MQKTKTILCGLFLIVISSWCSDKTIISKKALPCILMTQDKKTLEQLEKNSTKPMIKYRFNEKTSFVLHYNKKHNRGIVYDGFQNYVDAKPLARLKITLEQFRPLSYMKANQATSSESRSSMYRPNNPVYIVAETLNSYSLFKITSIETSKHVPVYEAGYNSDTEETNKKCLAAAAIGCSIGTVIGGTVVTFFLFWYKLKQWYYAC